MPGIVNDIDYRLAFELAPIGMVLSRNRTMEIYRVKLMR
jgi:hypothetical protein